MIETSRWEQEESPERRLEDLPTDLREKMEGSWSMLQNSIKKGELPEGVTISKIENENPESTKANVAEMQDFFQSAFHGEEMVDSMQMEIGMTHKIVDYYGARDAEGKLITLMSSQMVETKTDAGDPELSMIVWYVANRSGYRGKSLVKELAGVALSDFLVRSQQELKIAKAILGEAELGDDDAVRREKAFNRFAGMNRVFGKNKKGELSEVLYEAPPEDESAKGAPANFMVRFVDGSNAMNKEEYIKLVRGIHRQYTRPEYFTPEYFNFCAEQEGEEVDPKVTTPEAVDQYRQRYLGIVEKIQAKLEKRIKPFQGDLVLLSEREKRKSE
jgi:hypothetical protein